MIDNLSQNTRLIIACILSTIVIFIWQYFFVEPMIEENREEYEKTQLLKPTAADTSEALLPREEVLAHTIGDRVAFENGSIKGSVNLLGLRIDDLVLTKYDLELNNRSYKVPLLSPSKSKGGYFIEFGYNTNDKTLALPDEKTRWNASQSKFEVGKPVIFTHTNAQGVSFKVEMMLDAHYMFRVKQSVVNKSGKDIELGNYGLINKIYHPNEENNIVFHEGFVGASNSAGLHEMSYGELQEERNKSLGSYDWFGFSDKYWLTSFAQNNNDNDVYSSSSNKNNVTRLQLGFTPKKLTTLKSGATHEFGEVATFVGAKELDVIESYQNDLHLYLFDRVVDFGRLYFITKPLYYFLSFIQKYIGNFGISILILTLVIKIALFPLAYKGISGMNKMKDLQPKIQAIKERCADDSAAFQKALIDLYKKEKINPMGGCLPILLQIPIFFALYKVLYISIEMRHAPFFGWIQDLSAPDPLTIFNLFGLIPWTPPAFLMIGILPILMSLSMYVQQRLSPEPTDPTQAKVMRMMPLIMLFMFSAFPSGLIVYWTFSNILSILQQVLIKKLEVKKKGK